VDELNCKTIPQRGDSKENLNHIKGNKERAVLYGINESM